METKNNIIKVSPSGISSLLECPRCLWLQMNENVKRPRGIYPSLPNGMDDVFKKYFDEYRGGDSLPPEIDGKFIPFDFKTRGYPTKEDTHEHYRTQLDLYALLFEKNGHKVAPFGYLLFFWPQSYGIGNANFKSNQS